MVDDDEVAVALELVGERDGSLVDVVDGLSLLGLDLHAVSDYRRAEAAGGLAAERP